MPLPVIPAEFRVASTKPAAALGRSAGSMPAQGRGWLPAPRDSGPETVVDCREGHYRVAGIWAGRTMRPRPTKRSDIIAAHVIPKLISETAAAGYACVSLMYWM